MWNRQELQIENARGCAEMGIITDAEAFEVFRAIRDQDDGVIKRLYAERRLRDGDIKTEAD